MHTEWRKRSTKKKSAALASATTSSMAQRPHRTSAVHSIKFIIIKLTRKRLNKWLFGFNYCFIHMLEHVHRSALHIKNTGWCMRQSANTHTKMNCSICILHSTGLTNHAFRLHTSHSFWRLFDFNGREYKAQCNAGELRTGNPKAVWVERFVCAAPHQNCRKIIFNIIAVNNRVCALAVLMKLCHSMGGGCAGAHALWPTNVIIINDNNNNNHIQFVS